MDRSNHRAPRAEVGRRYATVAVRACSQARTIAKRSEIGPRRDRAGLRRCRSAAIDGRCLIALGSLTGGRTEPGRRVQPETPPRSGADPVPDAVMHCSPRQSLGKLWRMSFHYGYFKLLVGRKIGGVRTVRQTVPPAFVAGALAAWVPCVGWACAAIALAYAAVAQFAMRLVTFTRGIDMGRAAALCAMCRLWAGVSDEARQFHRAQARPDTEERRSSGVEMRAPSGGCPVWGARR